ncbi:MAG: hypothetical protein K2G11_01285 [Muribaculaceae bacterium]|nr:hypothetical protein [Muribaculaceae bacterium]
MSTLSELYITMENLRKLNLPIDERLKQEAAKLEEDLIRTEILPTLTEKIEPALAQVQRELVLVVDYVPGAPLKVSLSRKRNITDVLPDAVEIKPDPVVEHAEKKKGGKKVVTNPRTRLRITMPDGSIIDEQTALESLRKFVLKVGIDKVRAVGLIANKIPLVSNTVDKKYQTAQKPLGNGWLLMTCSDTATKRKQILAIASHIGINIKVDII